MQEDPDVVMFVCDNDQDNVPITKGFVSETGEEVAFSISQSRSSGKKVGQDAIAALSRGNYECCVICDGHDVHGDIVARGISKTLAALIIDHLFDLPSSSDLSSQDAEGAILEAFQDCERYVMWTNESIQPNSFVKITSGEFEGMVGYVSDVHYDDSTYSVIVIDARNFHKPRLQKKQLECAKYTGGCTCVVYVRDAVKNIARVAVMGDTRVLLVNGKKSGLEKDTIFEEVSPGAFLSYPHDVFNTAELHRIQTDIDPKDYEIDGPYLINPFTGCEIQPTRGFGDFDMYGSGFINVPDISVPFTLTKGSLLLVASDGIFDDQVWDFRGLVKFIEQRIDPKHYKDLETLASEVHKETVKKSVAGGYVDDISFFMCCVEAPKLSKTESTASVATVSSTVSNGATTTAATASTDASRRTSTLPVSSTIDPKKSVVTSPATDPRKSIAPSTDPKKSIVAATLASTSAAAPLIAKENGNGSIIQKFGLAPVLENGTKPTAAATKGTNTLPPRSPSLAPPPSSSSVSPPTVGISHSRKGSAMPMTTRSASSSQDIDARKKSSVMRHVRSLTHDSISMTRKTTFSSTHRQAREIRAQTVDASKPRYLTDQKQSMNKKAARKSYVETIRRTYGPSFMLPDGVMSASTSSKLGAEAAKLVAQNAVKDLSTSSTSKTTTSTSAATSAAAKKRTSVIDASLLAAHHANPVLQRIGK